MRWSEQDLDSYLRHTKRVIGERVSVETTPVPFHLPANEAGAFARGAAPIRDMNKTEAAYDAHLWAQRHSGDVLWHAFEGIKLRLAEKTFYTPDFAVLPRSGVIEIHETKGFWRDDARVKIKVAASIFPFRFLAITRRKRGGWDREEFS